MELDDLAAVLEGHLAVRLVPISADQVKVLESLDRAFFLLASDFQRDMGPLGDAEIAGGLYRIYSTLSMIATYWKEDAEDLTLAERRRAALERIRDGQLGEEEAHEVAREALG